MPVEPIALQVQTPAPISPLQSVGAIMQLRSGLQEQALRAAQAEQARAQTADIQAQAQQRNKDLADENTVQAVQGDPALAAKLGSGDFSALAGKVQPKTLQVLNKNYADMVAAKATQDTNTLTLNQKKHDVAVEALSGLRQLGQEQGEDKAIAEYPNLVSRLVAQGILKQGVAPDSISGLKDLDQFEAANNFHAGVNAKALATKKTQQEISSGAAKQAADEAEAALKNTEAAQKKVQQPVVEAVANATLADKGLLSPEERAKADQAAAALVETQARDKAAQEAKQKELLIQGGHLRLEQQKAGFEMGGGVSEAAKMAAAGEMDPATLRSTLRRSPGLLEQIRKVDPSFDEANIDKRYNTLKEFTSSSTGKAGGQVIALNTLIHHADLYQQVGEALKNGSFTPGNKVYNAVAQIFGSAPPQNAALVARFLAGETGKVATGGVPAEGEIKGILSNLSTSSSPEQIVDAGNTLLRVAAGRATPLMEKVKDAKLDNVVHVIGPDAQAILSRHGFNPETMKPAAAASGTYKAGDTRVINGVTYKRDDQGTWHPQ